MKCRRIFCKITCPFPFFGKTARKGFCHNSSSRTEAVEEKRSQQNGPLGGLVQIEIFPQGGRCHYQGGNVAADPECALTACRPDPGCDHFTQRHHQKGKLRHGTQNSDHTVGACQFYGKKNDDRFPQTHVGKTVEQIEFMHHKLSLELLRPGQRSIANHKISFG